MTATALRVERETEQRPTPGVLGRARLELGQCLGGPARFDPVFDPLSQQPAIRARDRGYGVERGDEPTATLGDLARLGRWGPALVAVVVETESAHELVASIIRRRRADEATPADPLERSLRAAGALELALRALRSGRDLDVGDGLPTGGGADHREQGERDDRRDRTRPQFTMIVASSIVVGCVSHRKTYVPGVASV